MSNGQKLIPKVNINQLAQTVEWMICHCGHKEFEQSFRLKYISPFACGQPKGLTYHEYKWKCKKCGWMYDNAHDQKEIDNFKEVLERKKKGLKPS